MTITIKNLRLRARVGVSDAERSADREIVVNVSFDYNAEEAARTDSLHPAVDYRRIRDRIAELVASKPFRLIETLAVEVAHELAREAEITRIEVEVDKPGALRLAESVSATHTWTRAV